MKNKNTVKPWVYQDTIFLGTSGESVDVEGARKLIEDLGKSVEEIESAHADQKRAGSKSKRSPTPAASGR